MNLLVRAFHAGVPSEIHAVRGLLDTARGMVETLQPDVIVFAAEGGRGHRHAQHPGYKASRSEQPPELRAQIELAQQALTAIGWPLISAVGFEADDVLATLASQHGQRLTIASTDKDLWQLVGKCRIYHPYEKKHIDHATVEERWGVGAGQLGDLLALMGDSSDDVPGVPGIGPKKAAQLLNEYESLEAILVQATFRQSGAGKMWASIWEHRKQATLSRQLVELVSHVPLPTGWETWPATRPRVQWIDKLRDLGLGSPAARLGAVFGECRRNESRLIEASRVCGQPSDANCPNRTDDGSYEIHDVQGDPVETVSPIPQGAAEQATDADPQSNPAPASPKSESPASVAATQDDSALPAAVGSAGDGGRVAACDAPTSLKPDEPCDNGRLAGRVYQDGQEWAAKSPNLASQAIAGTITPLSLWGREVGNWSVYWWAGATGQPFPTAPPVTQSRPALQHTPTTTPRRQASLF